MLGSRAFGWLRGLWKKRPIEPSFRLVRMKRVPTATRMYFEPKRETATPSTGSLPDPGEGPEPRRLGKRLVDQLVAHQEFPNGNPSGTALRRNTALKHAAAPRVEERSQATYRKSPGAITVERQDSVSCSQPPVVVKPKPTASGEGQKPDDRDMLPSRRRHQVTVMRPAPSPAPHSSSLRRRLGYRSLREAATDGDKKAKTTPLLNHLTRPSAGLSDLPSQLLAKHHSH
ncbi:hypothetical protein F5144DRAFT_543411 [Chaetomium tenue]|uniref:Uncharacterized protein n=1 Tax=Chaetomium tenue TaxID=1854479 RepID=A0ACB7PN98_9PEZI|nr:hypothetical protein F5144DRAFT_543411 [Chaetomium globosum]